MASAGIKPGGGLVYSNLMDGFACAMRLEADTMRDESGLRDSVSWMRTRVGCTRRRAARSSRRPLYRSSICSAAWNTALPAGVSRTGTTSAMSFVPNSFSIVLTWRLSVGCDTLSVRAAEE